MTRVVPLLAAAFFSFPALSQPATTLEKGETGRIVFRSVTPSGRPSDLAQRRPSPPAQVWGELTLPPKVSGKVPAMILLHTSGGISGKHVAMWQEKFVDMGLASFAIDSFSGRGIAYGHQFHRHAQMVDAYEALKLLATHPLIDGERVGLIGFSLGAIAAIEAPMHFFREVFGAGMPTFAAYFSLYPTCNYRYVGGAVRTEPLVVFVPEKEDWTVPAYCEKYVESLNARGGKARTVMLSGAYHGFDQIGVNQYKAAYENPGNCNVELSLKGMIRADTGEAIPDAEAFRAYWHGCSGKQASIVGDSAVTRRVEAEIKKVLSTAFNMPLK
jgi:dienelactone hydrolase